VARVKRPVNSWYFGAICRKRTEKSKKINDFSKKIQNVIAKFPVM
jgi:hypothetical protein